MAELPLERPSPPRLAAKDWRFGLIAVCIAIAAPLALAALGMRPHWPDPRPIIESPLSIQLHLAGVLGALAVGAVLMSGIKGTGLHKTLGWTWVGFMVLAAGASLFVQAPGVSALEMRLGPFSFLHLLSVWVLIALPWAVWAIKTGDVKRHSGLMAGTFFGGLFIAGAFTLIPGRLMWRVFFG